MTQTRGEQLLKINYDLLEESDVTFIAGLLIDEIENIDIDNEAGRLYKEKSIMHIVEAMMWLNNIDNPDNDVKYYQIIQR